MERIREMRKERGLTQVKLAVMADMDPATLNRLEQGTGNPSLKTLERVAAALDVEVADFFPKVSSPSLFNGLEGLDLDAAYWIENLIAQAELVEHMIGRGGYDLETIWKLEGAAVEFWGTYSKTVRPLVREWSSANPTQADALRHAETRMREARSAARRAYLELRKVEQDARVVDELETKRRVREARYAEERDAAGA